MRWAGFLWAVALACGQSALDSGKTAVFDQISFEKKVTRFALPNGLRFLVIERRNAPVVSFHTYVDAGSVDDPKGQTGLAHMFEHMAFKGTDRIGTRDYARERRALANIEKIYDRLQAERARGPRAEAARISALEKDLQAAIDKADEFVEPNEFDRIVEENGGVGMNAGTGVDSTNYYYNFPSNRLELWFLLESTRFRRPVFREFYRERDVVREERRMRVESDPQGKLVEALIATAFAAHPYRNMPGGWASDIEHFRQPEALAFFRKYYAPGNITIAIAGDVEPNEVRTLAARYFGGWRAAPPPERIRTVEPKQEGEKRVKVLAPAQPLLAIAWHRPDQAHADDAPLEVLSEILSGGRTSLFYRELVRDRQLALAAFSQPMFPGGKYPNLFLVFGAPNRGRSVGELEAEIYSILDRVKNGAFDPAALTRVKTNLRAELIRKLDSNSGLAAELAFYEANFGDWRRLFTSLDDIERVTAGDVQRVAQKYLTEANRTVAWIETAPPEESRSATPEGAR